MQEVGIIDHNAAREQHFLSPAHSLEKGRWLQPLDCPMLIFISSLVGSSLTFIGHTPNGRRK
jgi:hypothetical protein